MGRRLTLPGLAAGLLLAGSAVTSTAAETPPHHGDRAGHAQPYAGQQDRTIAGLSDEEMTGYREGLGMGLARPAELNGYPGPMHVLELAGELGLTVEQHQAVEAIFSRMRQAAKAAGSRYLEAERAMDAAFRSGTADADWIGMLVRQADSARAEVRIAHLRAHLETAPLLSTAQRHRYAQLRGYASGSGSQHRHSDRH